MEKYKINPTREDLEQFILQENPYNWKKHFYFHLPELLYDLIKITFVWFLFTVVSIAIISTAIASVISVEEDLAEYITVTVKENI